MKYVMMVRMAKMIKFKELNTSWATVSISVVAAVCMLNSVIRPPYSLRSLICCKVKSCASLCTYLSQTFSTMAASPPVKIYLLG